jgi:hypothetical protein
MSTESTTQFRHSREGGNPFLHIALPVRWIPAFAGMTVVRLVAWKVLISIGQ